MIAMAVFPMASPIKKRRSSVWGNARCTGDAGCSRRVAKVNAEIIKSPRETPSIKYSGQWFLRTSVIRYGAGSKKYSRTSHAECFSRRSRPISTGGEHRRTTAKSMRKWRLGELLARYQLGGIDLRQFSVMTFLMPPLLPSRRSRCASIENRPVMSACSASGQLSRKTAISRIEASKASRPAFTVPNTT